MQISGAPYVVDLGRPQAAAAESKAAQAVQGASPPARVLSFDRVEISPRMREIDRLKRDLSELPELRLDRVALARQNLQAGGYRVDPAIVAHNMMKAFGTR